MSAIYGYITANQTDFKLYANALKTWNASYGKDAGGQLNFENTVSHICLGSVTNHLNDAYPVGPSVIKTDSFYAVIDAVIYNREELETKLGISGLNPTCDEELLFHWIIEKGYEALKEVSGDFAGAIYSKTENSITLFRDHLGVRPLFYYLDDSLFAFSTDLRGLTAIPDTNTGPDEEILFQKMVGYSELTPDKTDYKNIHCALPAHFMTITKKDSDICIEQTEYWSLGSKKIRMKHDEDYAKEMCRLVTEAIESRLKAVSGTVGAELSGGLDSGVISIILNRTGRNCKYYCWSMDPSFLPIKDFDERKVVFDICNQENISCHFRQSQKEYTVHDFTYGIRHFDVPYINTLILLEGASWLGDHGAKVVFSGYGGDEGVSHRPNPYELWYHHEHLAYIKAMYRSTKGQSLRLLRTLKRFFISIKNAKSYYEAPFDLEYPSRKYLNPAFVKACEKKYPPKVLQFQFDPTTYIKSGGPRIRMDLSSFIGPEAGIQYMFPYLDYKVLDFAVSIPRRLYNDGTTNRLIYRKAFRHLMPDSLYEVDYKIMPSEYEYAKNAKSAPDEPDKEALAKHLRDQRNLLLKHLDKQYWACYLDFEKINQIGEDTNISFAEYQESKNVLNNLMYCAYLQNVGINIKEYTHDL